MSRSPAPKLTAYVSLSAAGLFAGLLLGRVELVILAVPLLCALVIGLTLTIDPVIELETLVDAGSCLEQEDIRVTIMMVADDRDREVEIALVVPDGFEERAGGTRTVVTVERNEPYELVMTLRARHWGAYRLGLVALRVYGPGRLILFEEVVDRRHTVLVYPRVERMKAYVQPPQTQVYAGNYVSRASGDGIEFAGVRPFSAGDSRRRVNWRVSSRRGELHVNEFHPERNSDVVLFLDTFADVGLRPNTSLDLAVRGAATLARYYLHRKDRVGLVAFGGLLGWLTADTGQSHLHRIVDYLIGVEAKLSYARKEIRYLPPRTLPQLSLVTAFSPLVDPRALQAFVDLQGRGYHLIIVDTLDEDAVTSGPSMEDRVARKAWKLQRAAQRFDLGTLGVPVVRWSGTEELEAAVAGLPPLRRMPRARRA